MQTSYTQLISLPIGIYPGAAANLLLFSPDGHDALNEQQTLDLQQLLLGRLPEGLNPQWAFFASAAKGDMAAAISSLNSLQFSSQLNWQIVQYNLFVLEPSLSRLESLRQIKDLVPEIDQLLQVVAFNYGMADKLEEPTNLDGVLLAWALAAKAAWLIEHDNLLVARQTLSRAVELAKPHSPLLAAILLAQSAQLAQHSQVPAALIQAELEQAIKFAEIGSLPGLLAQLYMELGMLLQRSSSEDRQSLQDAIRAYQMALQSGITSQSNPTAFAELQNNLGLAYLSMPATESSNQLRIGIAIQSFRNAIQSISIEQAPELWARIQMNLANALQYAPSSHPEANLILAVEIYEQVLAVRSRANDPVAYALVILNQANALAHLGIFKPALEKAAEAYKLFQWYNQPEQAATARGLVESVNDRIGKCRESSGANVQGDNSAEPAGNENSQELQHESA